MHKELQYANEYLDLLPEGRILGKTPDKDTRMGMRDIAMLRRIVRSITDRVIHEALMTSNLTGLASGLGSTMLDVATGLGHMRMEPEVNDFVTAAKELIEDARIPWDKGLKQMEFDDVRISAVMMEIVVRGIFSTLNLPYQQVIDELHRARMAHARAVSAGEIAPDAEPFPIDIDGIISRNMMVDD
jgi:hypothetical protein